WIGRVRKYRHPADPGYSLDEQLQLFRKDVRTGAAEGQARNVPSRVPEAVDKPACNRIADANHDDGDRAGSVLSCNCNRRCRGYNDVHAEPDQLCREVGQPVVPILRESIIDGDVLTLNPPEFA